MNPCITILITKNFRLIQILDLRFQVDHINGTKIQTMEKLRVNTNIARLLTISIRHKENKKVWDGKKSPQERHYKKDNTFLENFMKK